LAHEQHDGSEHAESTPAPVKKHDEPHIAATSEAPIETAEADGDVSVPSAVDEPPVDNDVDVQALQAGA
jgi:hypothetical protein